MRGQTLGRLHYHWEVGGSFIKILTRRKLLGWICVGSIAAVTFTALESLLQQASSAGTMLRVHRVNMTTTMPNALPAGFSGLLSESKKTEGTSSFTSVFNGVVQNHTANSLMKIDLDGCPSTSTGWCAATLPGVGFQYSCSSGRTAMKYPATFPKGICAIGCVGSEPENTVFNVTFDSSQLTYDVFNPTPAWTITLDVVWKDKAVPFDHVGNKLWSNTSSLSTRYCTLTPAIVNYPVNVSAGIVTLQDPSSHVQLRANTTGASSQTLATDEVVKVLPELQYDKTQMKTLFDPGTHSTLGGIALALSRLFDSSVTMKSDWNNDRWIVDVQGALAEQFSDFTAATNYTNYLDTTFASPMDALMANIRDIMFRSSLAIAQHNVSDYVLTGSPERVLVGETFKDHPGSTVPAASIAVPGEYGVVEAVYETNRMFMGIALGLMGLAMIAILPLYNGFWRLGRRVSLSPFEIARALHNAHLVGADGVAGNGQSVLDAPEMPGRSPQAGSNLSNDELIDMLGDTKVRYGEVQSSTLGIGLYERTNVPRKGATYS